MIVHLSLRIRGPEASSRLAGRAFDWAIAYEIMIISTATFSIRNNNNNNNMELVS